MSNQLLNEFGARGVLLPRNEVWEFLALAPVYSEMLGCTSYEFVRLEFIG